MDIREAFIVEADGTFYIFPDLFELTLKDLSFGNVNKTINHCSLEVLIVDDYILRGIELISHVRDRSDHRRTTSKWGGSCSWVHLRLLRIPEGLGNFWC